MLSLGISLCWVTALSNESSICAGGNFVVSFEFDLKSKKLCEKNQENEINFNFFKHANVIPQFSFHSAVNNVCQVVEWSKFCV